MSPLEKLTYARFDVYQGLLDRLKRVAKSGRIEDFTEFEVALARVRNEMGMIPEDQRGNLLSSLEEQGYPSAIFDGDYIRELNKVVLETNLLLNGYRKRRFAMESSALREFDEFDDIEYETELRIICNKGLVNFKYFMMGMDETDQYSEPAWRSPQSRAWAEKFLIAIDGKHEGTVYWEN